MKREKETIVKLDLRNRVTIPKKMAQNLSQLYKIYEKDGKIILEPVKEISKEEQWLFDPRNKAIIDELKASLKQKADREIDLSLFDEE